MRIWRTAACILLALALVLSLAACGGTGTAPAGQGTPAPAPAPTEAPQEPVPTAEPAPAEEPVPTAEPEPVAVPEPTGPEVLENDGMTLSIPAGYGDLLIVDVPQDDGNGILFNVSEKASAEAAAAQGFEGGGLFRIGKVSEETLHGMLCFDMSGAEVFAKDNEGNYYMFYHPTDVQFVRDSYEGIGDETNEDWKQWTMLNEWAFGSVRDAFMEENGLTPFRRGNSLAESYLNRAAYLDGAKYTVSTLEFGPLEPEGVDAAPFVERLLEGLTLTEADLSETPDGEYAVVNFPDDELRLDFFFGDGRYIRQYWAEGNETLYLASYEDGRTLASDVVLEWYEAIAAARGLPVAGSGEATLLTGVWADSVAGRAMITFGNLRDGACSVEIRWSSSAFESSFWEMTAVPEDDGRTFRYEDCVHSVVTFGEDEQETREIIYENGSGAFLLNDNEELTWQDDMEQAGDGVIFLRADR